MFIFIVSMKNINYVGLCGFKFQNNPPRLLSLIITDSLYSVYLLKLMFLLNSHYRPYECMSYNT